MYVSQICTIDKLFTIGQCVGQHGVVLAPSNITNITPNPLNVKGVVNCQNSRDKGPPEDNSARG